MLTYVQAYLSKRYCSRCVFQNYGRQNLFFPSFFFLKTFEKMYLKGAEDKQPLEKSILKCRFFKDTPLWILVIARIYKDTDNFSLHPPPDLFRFG